MRVQTLRPEMSVERRDESFVCRLARATEVECDAMLVDPRNEMAEDAVETEVDADRLRIAVTRTRALQSPNHMFAATAQSRIKHPDVA